jgi:hypothetical protein
MWSMSQLAFFNQTLKFVLKSQKDFAGMQIVCLGDHAQLPPVVKDVHDAYDESCIFSELMSGFSVFQLETPHRQLSTEGSGSEEDIEGRQCTIAALHAMRNYDWDQNCFGLITYRRPNPALEREDNVFDALCITDDTPIIAYHNETVNHLNQLYLSRLSGEEVQIVPFFKAATPQQLENWTLTVKPGCVIFFTRTIRPAGTAGKGFCAVNGTRGILESIEGPTTLSPDSHTHFYVTVDGYDHPMKFPCSITKTGPFAKKQEVLEKSVPFRNGPAMTIHKSQGQTFDKGVIFTKGMRDLSLIYVAFSRFTNIMNATLVGPSIHPLMINVPDGRRRLDDRVRQLCEST